MVYWCHVFIICSLVNGHPDYLCVLTIVKRVTTETNEPVSLQEEAESLGICPGMVCLSHRVDLFLAF